MSDNNQRTPRGEPAPTAQRNEVKRLVKDRGARATALHLGLNPHTVIRICAGQPVLPGTLALLREKLADRAHLLPGGER